MVYICIEQLPLDDCFSDMFQIAEDLSHCSNLDERLDKVSSSIASLNPGLLATEVKAAARTFIQHLKMAESYEVKGKYKGDITLIAAEKSAAEAGLNVDYGLKQVW